MFTPLLQLFYLGITAGNLGLSRWLDGITTCALYRCWDISKSSNRHSPWYFMAVLHKMSLKTKEIDLTAIASWWNCWPIVTTLHCGKWGHTIHKCGMADGSSWNLARVTPTEPLYSQCPANPSTYMCKFINTATAVGGGWWKSSTYTATARLIRNEAVMKTLQISKHMAILQNWFKNNYVGRKHGKANTLQN